MDKRLKEINSRLSEYSIGNFDNNIKISPRLDEVDAISSGINMLGEELKSITISRDYFNNIFNSVSDMVFILNLKGIITDANKSAKEQMRYEHDSLIGEKINELIHDPPSFFSNMVSKLKIVDNGRGFDNKQMAEGMGLQNVKSRIKSHNGTLDIVSNIGKGTCYKIGIPIIF